MFVILHAIEVMTGGAGRPHTRGPTSTEPAPDWAKALQDETVTVLKLEITAAVDKLDNKFTNIRKPIKAENVKLRKDITSLTETVAKLSNQIALHNGMVGYLRARNKSNRDRQIRMESYSMRENIIISGMAESSVETESDLYEKLEDLFSRDMSVDMSNVSIVRCHRLRKFANRSGPRNVIVRFSSHLGKMAVMKSARNLKGRTIPIFINDQFPREINSQRGTLRPIMKLGKKLGKKCSLVEERLLVDGKSYTVDTLADLPFDISELATKMNDEYVFFSGRTSPYSNFFTSDDQFTLHDISYCSSEQYYQHQKAVHCNNYIIAAEIMDTSDPVTMKHAANRIKDTGDWMDKHARAIMEEGVRAKFTQNQELATAIELTGTRIFQECNQYDSYWGTGLSLSDAFGRADHSQVKGKNVMGDILVAVRDSI